MSELPAKDLLEVHEFSQTAFFEALSNPLCVAAEVAGLKKPRYLLEYLQGRAQTLVVELQYTDVDYLEDYASFYVRCWHPFGRLCRRIHFFEKSFSERRVLHAISGGRHNRTERELARSYLGFVVARPLPDTIVGRTVLKPPPNGPGVDFDAHPHALRTYTPNLLGLKLVVRGLAFQEQDTVIAACSTVALWTAFHKAQELFPVRSFSPAAITRAATTRSPVRRQFPTHGLTQGQMAEAVRGAGLEPELYDTTAKQKEHIPFLSLIYAHARAGLPVVLTGYISGKAAPHALTVIGVAPQEVTENLAAARCWPIENQTALQVPMVGRRIPALVVHDDQIGPYATLKVSDRNLTSKEAGGTYTLALKGKWDGPAGKESTFYPITALVPVYHKIRLSFVELYRRILQPLEVVFSAAVVEGEHEWDARLTTVNDLKHELRGDLGRRMDEADRDRLLFMPQPKYIWRIELKQDASPVADFLVDATAVAQEIPLYAIIWHTPEAASRFRWLLSHDGFWKVIKTGEEVVTLKLRMLLKQAADTNRDLFVRAWR